MPHEITLLCPVCGKLSVSATYTQTKRPAGFRIDLYALCGCLYTQAQETEMERIASLRMSADREARTPPKTAG